MLTSPDVAAPRREPRGRTFRLLYVVSHPIQYQAPLLRRLARNPALDIDVAFHGDYASGPFFDPGFDREVEWDIPLLDGYRHVFLQRGRRRVTPTGWRRAHRMLASGGYDAVWLHGYASAMHWSLAMDARRRGISVLLRGESASFPDTRPRAGWKAALLVALVRRCDALLAIGAANARFYRELGASPSRIFPVPYAVDNAAFRRRARIARAARPATRRALALDDDRRPILLFCGKLEPRKRPLDLIAAMRRLPRERRPYLILAGDGALRDDVARAARPLGDAVRMVGFVGQRGLPALYDLCDALVLPSHHEPWGLVVNEAMSVGRAAVVTDRVGCAEDLVTDAETGFVVPVGDVDLLAERLASLAADRVAARRMGRRARERLRAFSFSADEDGLLAALRGVVP